MTPRRALAALVLAALALPPVVSASATTPGAGGGAVGVTARQCALAGATWTFADGEYASTLGSGSFSRAVLVGEGRARVAGDLCAFYGRGVIASV